MFIKFLGSLSFSSSDLLILSKKYWAKLGDRYPFLLSLFVLSTGLRSADVSEEYESVRLLSDTGCCGGQIEGVIYLVLS